MRDHAVVHFPHAVDGELTLFGIRATVPGLDDASSLIGLEIEPVFESRLAASQAWSALRDAIAWSRPLPMDFESTEFTGTLVELVKAGKVVVEGQAEVEA